jgi:hypothetical protein
MDSAVRRPAPLVVTLRRAIKRGIVAVAMRSLMPRDFATWLIARMGLRHV